MRKAWIMFITALVLCAGCTGGQSRVGQTGKAAGTALEVSDASSSNTAKMQLTEQGTTGKPAENSLWKQAIDQTLEVTAKNIPVFVNSFPHVSDPSWKYAQEQNNQWTAGFWPGILWLSYEYSKDEKFKKAAEQALPSFKDRLGDSGRTDTHDIGFLYSLSSAAQWMVGKDPAAKQLSIQAADVLYKRYRPETGIIQAWGKKGDKTNGARIIIDTMLNIPLLYWATETTKDEKYKKAAIAQADKTMHYIVRPDAGSFHTYFFDPANGKPLRGATHQGFSDESTWSRGQSWGIYGFALSYRYTKNPEYLETSRKMAKYFIERLPADKVAYWDFSVPVDANTPRDSSASAIAVCGVLELLEHLPQDDKDRAYFRQFVEQSMKSLVENYAVRNEPAAQGFLKYGAYNVKNKQFNQHVIWGDYFYLEALMRLEKGKHGYWYE